VKKSVLVDPHHQAGVPLGGLPYSAIHQSPHTEAPEDSKQDCGSETTPNQKNEGKEAGFFPRNIELD
jgi:hypothetical protein